MAEVIEPIESIDRRRDRREKTSPPSDDLPPPPVRRRDSRDDREDRPVIRRSEYRERRSPPPPRDFKRRLSPSPPSASHRDRRHSPSRRSPGPPSFKRSRRDDGGFDRRGSPRGGYGFDDRRYPYEYGGGYDRGYGSRLGNADEVPHDRYTNRSADWPDRVGYADISNMGPTQREGLMSYKQFIQELEDDILPSEAERRYTEYKSEYISTQKHAFFDVHKEEEWLKDKYHPTNLVSVIERRNEHARAAAKDFLLDLQSGTLELGPSISGSSTKLNQGADLYSDDETDADGKRRRHGRGPVRENDLLATAPKAHPLSSETRRIQIDIEQTLVLVRKLDKEKGIDENVLTGLDQGKPDEDRIHSGSLGPVIIVRGLTAVKGLEGVELLDTLLTYLWRIHGVDYYGMLETNEAKGLRHVRAEGKNADNIGTDGGEWEKKIDSFWQRRLEGQDPLEKMAAKEKIDAAAVQVLDPYVRKIKDDKYGWKYGCGAKGCAKLFHAPEYVHKHLKLKHPDFVMELTSKMRDDLYFENYMNDPDAPGGTPVMQQQLPKERLPRRKSGPDSRGRDDRGGRRDLRDRIERGHDNGRYEHGNSPSRDFPAPSGGREDGAPDEAMYDSYGGQVPAPPVLMPVPGAGPLGPFVPAPPEVAMRMLRDQGGQSSFDSSDCSRGRKGGRSGLPVSAPAPFLTVSPGFRRDPRRMRSYNDLDAPDDEVTVIDYRSL